jgi:hypothetical protein
MMNTHKPSRMFPFLAGLVLGILAAVFLPGYVRPYLPQWMMGKMVAVKGTVAAKEKKDQALLLTVETGDGVLLATFNRKVDEINLLINVTDAIEFNLPKYMPFIEDPRIIRVVKAQQAPEPAPLEKPKAQGVKEEKPRKQEKPATAPGTGGTGTRPPVPATAPSTTMP